jgi:hypothetical protein
MGKKLLYLTIFMIVFLPNLVNTVNAADPDLVGWWKLDDGAGLTAVDSSGNGNDGTINGTPTWINPGKYGGALEFNGTDCYINCGNGPSLNQFTNQITMCFWLKTPGFTTTFSTVISKGDGAWRMGRNAGGNVLHMGYTGANYFDGSTPVTDDEWHFCTGVYNGTMATIYVDGAADTTSTATVQIPSGGNYNVLIGYNEQQTGRYYRGQLDDVRVYKRALDVDELIAIMNGLGQSSELATDPSPEDTESDVSFKTSLGWTPGEFADTHNVFFGTDLNDVNNATVNNPLGVTVAQALDVNSYIPGALEYGVTYFWRVDEVNAPSKPGSYKGDVWSFTSEPYVYKLPADRITVTAISSAKGNDPINTINEAGLDPNTDEHSNGSGSWASSGTDTNDVWIRYDFDKAYKLQEMLVWNYNHTLLWRYGFKDVLIEYSEDGQTWTQNTSVTQFDRASGKPDYVYNTVVPFNGVSAKSVRITALSNWGTYKNSGLSEIRFIYLPVRARYPKPEADSNEVSINTTLSWRPGREAVSHNVYISTSEEAIENGSAPVHTVTVNSYVPSLNLGQAYYWRVDEANNSETPSLWQGDMWSFISQEYVTIDNFEDYNDSSGYEIWSTWIDGYGIDENGSQMGHTNAPFAEKTIKEQGRQSAPIYYDNTTAKANYSEVTRTFDSTMNWQVSGADTIRLYYHGVADQAAENLYIALEDSTGKSAKVFAPADALGTTEWTEWVIPYSQFTGVNMTKIKKISIGVGDTPTPLKGSGVVYIDNIGYGHAIEN